MTADTAPTTRRRRVPGRLSGLALAAALCAALLVPAAGAAPAEAIAPVGPSFSAQFSAAPKPTVAGTAVLGATLTARPGAWKPAPKSFRYSWLRNGKPIPKATGAAYRLTRADLGKKISVSVAGVRSGHSTLTRVSAQTRAVAGAVRYPNCTALNRVYPHGVGKPGARDRVSGRSKPVTTFLVSADLYAANQHSDRDRDGIACEKR